MAQSKDSSKENSGKGFGSLDETKKREMASKGGRASAKSDTSNRGFASMDKDKQREISSLGGKASRSNASAKSTRPGSGRNEDKAGRFGIDGDAEKSERDLNSLEDEDEVMASMRGNASYSETDEDEDEGVGDGNLGRSSKSPGSDEEG